MSEEITPPITDDLSTIARWILSAQSCDGIFCECCPVAVVLDLDTDEFLCCRKQEMLSACQEYLKEMQ